MHLRSYEQSLKTFKLTHFSKDIISHNILIKHLNSKFNLTEVMKNNSDHDCKSSKVKWKDADENGKNSRNKLGDKGIDKNTKKTPPRKNESRRPSVMISLLIKTDTFWEPLSVVMCKDWKRYGAYSWSQVHARCNDKTPLLLINAKYVGQAFPAVD
ncbi:hypothetical protein KQX54_012810 [Cotesia glomerata]|uniref:Uncharacterized protein n=1 Tax=Cotesia glomerata TaxID=32391 RepID=A0AAV7IN94_COTGL|nr:hypothetical protein KQX54_012810 [Cotesia glomerata]